MIFMVALSFTVSNVSAKENQNSDQNREKEETLSGAEAGKYLNAVEHNKAYKDLFSSKRLLRKDAEGNKASVLKVQLDENRAFTNDIVIVESKVGDTGIIAIVDKETFEVFSVSTVEESEKENGMTVTEYDGESGEILLQNNLVGNKVVEKENSVKPMKIDKGSYWWKVICNLSTGGSCSLGCLALIAVPGGYPICVPLCSAFAGGAAC